LPYTRPTLTLAAAAVLLLLPSLLAGTLISHSSPQNLTWAAQFADQFRAGILYPRVVPDSYEGLGGATFYFYPPLAFWVDALASVATFNLLSVSYRLSFAWLILLLASGLAMHAWLKDQTVSPRAAFYGALAYMAAPYHLLDHYYRGAYAEFAAYAVLPLIALSIRRIAEDRRFGALWLAVAYAALPMAHLPTSLLISLTAIPLYVLYRGWRLGTVHAAAGFFLRCALGGALGLGIAAIYLVPSLTLQGWIPAENFWAPDYRVENWFLLTPGRWPERDTTELVAWFAAAYAIAALGVVAQLARRPANERWQSEPAFWVFVGLLCLVFIAGLVPWFWQLPFAAKVQFPWRLMIVVEFAAITALSLAPWQGRARATSYIFIAALAVLAPGLGTMAAGIRHRVVQSQVEADPPQDLNQFMPVRYPQKTGAGYADLSLEPLQGVPTIACAPLARTCRATNDSFGRLRIEIDAEAPTTVVLRRFAYPYWRLVPDLPLTATDPLQLVSFTAPAGHGTFALTWAAVREERFGWLVSGFSLAVLALWALLLRRGHRHAP
jgi:hypothetical protein